MAERPNATAAGTWRSLGRFKGRSLRILPQYRKNAEAACSRALLQQHGWFSSDAILDALHAFPLTPTQGGVDRSELFLEPEETQRLSANHYGAENAGQPLVDSASTWWVSENSNTSTRMLSRQRELATSSSTSGGSEICETVEEIGRECFWCMQWDCEQGYYKESTPDCYHDTMAPVDDDFHLGDTGTYAHECSDQTCCEENYSGVFTCRGFPSCPSGYEPLWVACSAEGSTELPACGEGACCGVSESTTSREQDAPNRTSAEEEQVSASETVARASVVAAGTGVMGGVVLSGAGGGASSSQVASSVSRVAQLAVTDAPASAIARQPSATMSVVLVGQLQFLATLTLVDYARTSSSWLSHLTEALRWMNLWPPDSFAQDFSFTEGSRRLQEEDDSSSSCFVETSGDLGALVYVGNLVLFAGILGALVALHISIASGIEAYWLTKEFAHEAAGRAQLHGVPLSKVLVPWRLDEANAPAPSGESARVNLQQSFEKRHLQPWPSRKTGLDSTQLEVEDDEAPPARSNQSTALLLQARRSSRSAWLYFPHIELLFLFFAFEGALAAQLAAIRENGCPWVVVTAGTTLVMYPVLMIAMIYRTFQARVRPDSLIVFRPNSRDDCEAGDYGADGFRKPSLFSRVWAGVKHDHSLFAWADTGSWETVETDDEQTRFEGDQFRIGFEPLFVDFTKNGSWFMMFYLLEVTAQACVGILIDDSVIQFSLLCGLCSTSAILLVLAKPFANSVINAMAACQSIADAVCMGLLAIAAAEWDGTIKAEYVDRAVVFIELVCLGVLAIPIYVDTVLALLGAIRDKLTKSRTSSEEDCRHGRPEEQSREKQAFVRRYIRGTWASTWCAMVGSNVFTCVRDTSRGVRKVSVTAERPFALEDRFATVATSSAVAEGTTLSEEMW